MFSNVTTGKNSLHLIQILVCALLKWMPNILINQDNREKSHVNPSDLDFFWCAEHLNWVFCGIIP